MTELAQVIYAEWVSMAGNALYVMVVLAVAQYRSHDGTFWVGLISAVMLMPPLFSGIFGIAIDAAIRRRKHLLMFADAARVLLVAITVFTVKFDAFVVMVVLSGLVSALNTLFGQTFRTWIPSVVPPHKLRRTTGLYQTGNTVAQVFAAAAGFFAFHWSVTTPPLVFDVGTFVLSLVILWMYVDKSSVDAGKEAAPKTSTRNSSFKNLLTETIAMGRWPFIRILLPLLALNSLAFLPYAHLLPSWVRDVLHYNMQLYPGLEAAVVIGALAGNMWWNHWHSNLSLARWIGVSIGCTVFGMMLFVSVPTVITSIAGLFFIGVGTAIDGVAFSVFLQGNVPNRLLGRAFGLVGMFSQIGGPLALIAFALISSSHLVRPFFAVAPVTFAISAWWILRWVRQPNLVQQLGTGETTHKIGGS